MKQEVKRVSLDVKSLPPSIDFAVPERVQALQEDVGVCFKTNVPRY